MSVRMTAGKPASARVDAHQVCARGWQDYMIETKFFLGESRVDEALRGFATPELKKLGLSENDMRKVRAR